MLKAIDYLADLGKTTLAALSVIILTSCAPTQYAKRDYAQYPDYKNEIALHNIKQITNNICKDSTVTEERFRCKQSRYIQTSPGGVVPTGHGDQYRAPAGKLDERVIKFSWDGVREIKIVDNKEIYVNAFGNRSNILARDSRQAADLFEAMSIYLGKKQEERKEQVKKEGGYAWKITEKDLMKISEMHDNLKNILEDICDGFSINEEKINYSQLTCKNPKIPLSKCETKQRLATKIYWDRVKWIKIGKDKGKKPTFGVRCPRKRTVTVQHDIGHPVSICAKNPRQAKQLKKDLEFLLKNKRFNNLK